MIPRRFSATPSFIGKLTVVTLLLVYLWYWRPYRSSFQQEADQQSPQSIGTGTDQTSTISEHFNLHRQLMLGDYQLPSLLSSVTSSQPKVAIVTMYRSKAAELKPFTMENKKAYAKRHGYAFHDAQEDQMLRERLDKEPARNVLLTKFIIMEHYLKIYDWVMWSDSDALFLNHSRSLKAAGVLDERFSMIVAAGHPVRFVSDFILFLDLMNIHLLLLYHLIFYFTDGLEMGQSGQHGALCDAQIFMVFCLSSTSLVFSAEAWSSMPAYR